MFGALTTKYGYLTQVWKEVQAFAAPNTLYCQIFLTPEDGIKNIGFLADRTANDKR
jgi:hypothetical protein